MNIDNGHLVRLAALNDNRGVENETAARMSDLYKPIPQKLQVFAEEELAGKSETYVDLKAATPLANWAFRQRAARDKKKNKRLMSKKSKQLNRS